VAGDQARTGAPVQPHLDWLRDNDLMPLSELFSLGTGAATYHEGERRGTYYAQAWLLTHMLVSEPAADQGRLERVLEATRGGESFEPAFWRVFGDAAAMHYRLVAYLEHARFGVRDERIARPFPAPAPVVRERISPAEPLAALGIALLSRPTPEREVAEEHLQAALAIAPSDPEACAGAGWLALQRGKRDEARTWFGRALASEAVSVPAVRMIATQLLYDASQRQSEDERKAASTLARQALARAQAVAPTDPELD